MALAKRSTYDRHQDPSSFETIDTNTRMETQQKRISRELGYTYWQIHNQNSRMPVDSPSCYCQMMDPADLMTFDSMTFDSMDPFRSYYNGACEKINI
eukprot:scaffold753_cov73-Cylindrotheca_fusiformis.AAC.1